MPHWILHGCYCSFMSKNDILKLEKVQRREAKTIKGFMVIQAMPAWSGTLRHEKDMIQGAPLSSTLVMNATQITCKDHLLALLFCTITRAHEMKPVRYRLFTQFTKFRKGNYQKWFPVAVSEQCMVNYAALSGTLKNFLRLRLIIQVVPNVPSPGAIWTETKFL